MILVEGGGRPRRHRVATGLRRAFFFSACCTALDLKVMEHRTPDYYSSAVAVGCCLSEAPRPAQTSFFPPATIGNVVADLGVGLGTFADVVVVVIVFLLLLLAWEVKCSPW